MATEAVSTFYINSRESLMNLAWRLSEFSAGLGTYKGEVIGKGNTVEIPMFESFRKFLQATPGISWNKYSFVPTESQAWIEYVKTTTTSRFETLRTLRDKLNEERIPLSIILEAKDHIQTLYGLVENELREDLNYVNAQRGGSNG